MCVCVNEGERQAGRQAGRERGGKEEREGESMCACRYVDVCGCVDVDVDENVLLESDAFATKDKLEENCAYFAFLKGHDKGYSITPPVNAPFP